jgi:alpha-mannosidase
MEVPSQLILKNDKQYLRILAKDVPSLGYKVYDIKRTAIPAKEEKRITVSDSAIENSRYKIVFTPQGVITSLLDKSDNNREWIQPVNSLYANDLGSGRGRDGSPLSIENAGNISVTLVAESDRPVRHKSKLTLYGYNDRIELENYITQNLDAAPVTYAFSFKVDRPEIFHEEAGSIVKAKQVSEGGNYADSICRLDWLAMNHFAEMTDGNSGMILSNRDAFFMKTGNSTITRLDSNTPQISVLAAGQIDAPGLGIVNQDGDSYFENFLAMKPDLNGFNAASAMKFSLEHQDPLIAGKITGGEGSYGTQYSLFSVSDPEVLVWALKPSEEGITDGIIIRIWNMNNHDTDCTISSLTPIVKCFSTSHIETDQFEIPAEDGKLKIKIGHNRLQTFRIFLK